MKWGRYPVAVAVAVILRNEGSSIGYGKYPAAVAAVSYQRLAFSFEKGDGLKYPLAASAVGFCPFLPFFFPAFLLNIKVPCCCAFGSC
jgi:hypothetical protein